MISYMICKCSARKLMLVLQTALHTIVLLERSAWTCIFSSLPAWMSLQGSQMSFVQMICSLHHSGLSIHIENPTPFSTGCLRKWQLGSAITMGMN